MQGSAITYAIPDLLVLPGNGAPSIHAARPPEICLSDRFFHAGRLKQWLRLYAARITFSTAIRPVTMSVEGFLMRIRTIFVALALAIATATLAAPQATAPHDPPLIDTAGYQKIL